MRSRFAALVLILAGSGSAGAQEATPFPEKTTVSAYLQTGHQKGQNLVWCNSFQLAWTALGEEVLGEPPALQGSPPFERALNAGGVGKKDLDAESVFVKAGRISPTFLAEINASLKQKFGGNAPAPLAPADDREGVLAYAVLQKSLAFKHPFDRQREPVLWRGAEGEKTPFQAFGILKVDGQTPKELSAQVRILIDQREEYVVELKTASSDDRLILAQTQPKATFKETLDDVQERVRGKAASPTPLQATDRCLVPCVRVALDRVYDEILGRKVLNKKLEGFVVREARQTLRFGLDEKGATLKSEAELRIYKNGRTPRRIVFDRPFLLYLERVGAENPYLAIWFENPNLFLKAETPEKK